jgi:hypothetical protein
MTTIFGSVIRAGGFALCAAASALTTQAQTKTFEFGPGTPYQTSNVRTFPVPSGQAVSAVIKYQRLGSSDIPIVIELHEPDTSPGVEGPLVEARQVTAKASEQSVSILGLASARGCGLPWRVRVKFNGSGAVPAAVFGSARVDFDNRQRSISAETPGFIGKRGFKEIKIGDLNGFNQGKLGISANWNHMIGPVPGPNEIKFRVVLSVMVEGINQQLIVKSQEAYSTNESRNISPKFGMFYQVRERTRGQWSLYFENRESDDDAYVNAPTVNFLPVCP